MGLFQKCCCKFPIGLPAVSITGFTQTTGWTRASSVSCCAYTIFTPTVADYVGTRVDGGAVHTYDVTVTDKVRQYKRGRVAPVVVPGDAYGGCSEPAAPTVTGCCPDLVLCAESERSLRRFGGLRFIASWRVHSIKIRIQAIACDNDATKHYLVTVEKNIEYRVGYWAYHQETVSYVRTAYNCCTINSISPVTIGDPFDINTAAIWATCTPNVIDSCDPCRTNPGSFTLNPLTGLFYNFTRTKLYAAIPHDITELFNACELDGCDHAAFDVLCGYENCVDELCLTSGPTGLGAPCYYPTVCDTLILSSPNTRTLNPPNACSRLWYCEDPPGTYHCYVGAGWPALSACDAITLSDVQASSGSFPGLQDPTVAIGSVAACTGSGTTVCGTYDLSDYLYGTYRYALTKSYSCSGYVQQTICIASPDTTVIFGAI